MVVQVQRSHRTSAPRTDGPLAVYLIHARDRPHTHDLTLLADALDDGTAVVRETRRVQQLAGDNLGPRVVFGLAGELVKGGQQDRTLVADVLLAPGAREQPLATYCVEQARWHARGAEPADRFQTSHTIAPTTLRTLLTRGTHQNEVWNEVAHAQQRLGTLCGALPLRDARSATSLQLTLEHDALRHTLAERRTHFLDLPHDHDDVVGHVVAIGDRIHHAEWFASADLHQRLWPRLLDALLTDTLDATAASPPPTAAEVDAWIQRALDADDRHVDVVSQTVTRRLRNPTATTRQTLWHHAPLHTVVMAT